VAADDNTLHSTNPLQVILNVGRKPEFGTQIKGTTLSRKCSADKNPDLEKRTGDKDKE